MVLFVSLLLTCCCNCRGLKSTPIRIYLLNSYFSQRSTTGGIPTHIGACRSHILTPNIDQVLFVLGEHAHMSPRDCCILTSRRDQVRKVNQHNWHIIFAYLFLPHIKISSLLKSMSTQFYIILCCFHSLST